MSPALVNLALDILATYRLTRLLVEDELTEPIRTYIWKNHPPDDTKIGYFVTCPWCVSIWAGGLVVAARHLSPDIWDKGAKALSFSALTGMLSAAVNRI